MKGTLLFLTALFIIWKLQANNKEQLLSTDSPSVQQSVFSSQHQSKSVDNRHSGPSKHRVVSNVPRRREGARLFSPPASPRPHPVSPPCG
uniref:Secreted protein n=1 Tax=Caenorhabditis tropicalis TaxID=1561998 RepID=A0A1I7TMY6_9PELO